MIEKDKIVKIIRTLAGIVPIELDDDNVENAAADFLTIRDARVEDGMDAYEAELYLTCKFWDYLNWTKGENA